MVFLMSDDDSVDWERMKKKAKSTYEPPYLPTFSETRVIGNTAKEIVRTLLSGSGYAVYPFGYESYFTGIKDLVHQGKFDDVAIVEKIRSMPDLVVLDEELKHIDLVEVKFRNEYPTDISLKPKIVKRYETYWPESMLVCVTPYENPSSGSHSHFYSCKVEEIREKALDTSYWPDESEDYEGIVDVEFTEEHDLLEYSFPRVSANKEKLEKMRKLVRNILKDWSKRLKG